MLSVSKHYPDTRAAAEHERASGASGTGGEGRSGVSDHPELVEGRSDTPLITIVDFDAGNLHSVNRALRAVGQQTRITSDPRQVEQAEALVLPGVGSAQDAMRKLEARGLVGPLREYAASGRPFLGVCVGLQLLFDWSEEGGGVECLKILPGVVRRFPDQTSLAGLKVPQIGWNAVQFRYDHPLIRGIPGGSYFYFVHSYYAEPADAEVTLGVADYGLDFAAVVASENVLATQFHPEKSADFGLRVYANFARIAATARADVPAHSGR